MITKDSKILITGGHGFIGGHMARRLFKDGYSVRVTDISPEPYRFDALMPTEFIRGNLCDPGFCAQVVRGMDIVLHFAATMGGMGVIHPENDHVIYTENHSMTLNLLSASEAAGVRCILYASSACVYPESLQGAEKTDVFLKEDDVWKNPPPLPQGLYGLEKLNTEQVLRQHPSDMTIRIARFHNVFGPGGSWTDGAEKVPAALLRKSLAIKKAGIFPATLELWGDGYQRRSFCFIDDAVEGVLRLLQSAYQEPVNIGSDRCVTIQELSEIAVKCAELDAEQIHFRHDLSKPVGVASRNSDNTLVRSLFEGWAPSTALEEGMARTAKWISAEMDGLLSLNGSEERERLLAGMQTSKKVDLRTRARTFAVLLPITSRGSSDPQDCLRLLRRFSMSLMQTTADDTARLGEQFRVRVYLAIDHDDEALLQPNNKAETVVRDVGFPEVHTLLCNRPKGHVCALWRDLAHKAWEDGCDYFCLMGDDVVLHDCNWLAAVHSAFSALAVEHDVPKGVGCIAFMDTSFPGMPTFPVIHKTHMDIFSGQVIPDCFVNQDGDPFLFQLYRRWGCSRMVPCRISNTIGGSADARYEKVSADDWTFDILDSATATVESWLQTKGSVAKRMLTLDVIIPCYRVMIPYLDVFLSLQPSATCTVMFIIIVDDPRSPNTAVLEGKYAHRPDVRIRVNGANRGASYSRNRGLKESAAEWVLFLDDDVRPDPNILIEAERIIREHPQAAGFVGNAQFPLADSVFTAAVHLAGVTYFWDIATKAGGMSTDLPWGVTANLMTRRNIRDGVKYDLLFPKTGGGEDIDFCLRKRDFSVRHGGGGFHAAPDVTVTHPWWNNSKRSYWRFYMWSKGDGALVKLYPEYTYKDMPNAAESLCYSFSLILLGFTTSVAFRRWSPLLTLGIQVFSSIFGANVFHDMYRHLHRNADRVATMKTSITGVHWVLAVLESSFIRIFSECGRVVGLLERGDWRLLGTRFDWFTARAGTGPKNEERKNNIQRLAVSVAMFAILNKVHLF